MIKSGTKTIENRVSRQSIPNITTRVLTTVITLPTTPPIVSVITALDAADVIVHAGYRLGRYGWR